MTVEALINFYDTKNNNQLRKKGEQFKVSDKRGKYLIFMEAVRQVTVTKEATKAILLQQKIYLKLFCLRFHMVISRKE